MDPTGGQMTQAFVPISGRNRGLPSTFPNLQLRHIPNAFVSAIAYLTVGCEMVDPIRVHPLTMPEDSVSRLFRVPRDVFGIL